MLDDLYDGARRFWKLTVSCMLLLALTAALPVLVRAQLTAMVGAPAGDSPVLAVRYLELHAEADAAGADDPHLAATRLLAQEGAWAERTDAGTTVFADRDRDRSRDVGELAWCVRDGRTAAGSC